MILYNLEDAVIKSYDESKSGIRNIVLNLKEELNIEIEITGVVSTEKWGNLNNGTILREIEVFDADLEDDTFSKLKINTDNVEDIIITGDMKGVILNEDEVQNYFTDLMTQPESEEKTEKLNFFQKIIMFFMSLFK